MGSGSAMRAWAVKHWRCGIYIETVRRTRTEAIESFKEQFGQSGKDWADDVRFKLHRCVRVAVLPITTVRPARRAALRKGEG